MIPPFVRSINDLIIVRVTFSREVCDNDLSVAVTFDALPHIFQEFSPKAMICEREKEIFLFISSNTSPSTLLLISSLTSRSISILLSFSQRPS